MKTRRQFNLGYQPLKGDNEKNGFVKPPPRSHIAQGFLNITYLDKG